jgi:type I restriction enzyme S subunit
MFGDPVTNPMGWEAKQLGEIFLIIDGDRGENYPKGEDFFNFEYCLFLNAGNVTSMGFDFTKNQFITKEKDTKLRKGRLTRGDIVMTTRGTVGNIAYYNNSVPYDVMRINSGMVLLRDYVDSVEPCYFVQMVRNFNIMTQYLSGSAQPQLPISSMENIPLMLPPLPLQNRFAEFVKQADKSSFTLRTALTLASKYSTLFVLARG